jgi:hypothetical protein
LWLRPQDSELPDTVKPWQASWLPVLGGQPVEQRVFRTLPKTYRHAATLDALFDGLLLFVAFVIADKLISSNPDVPMPGVEILGPLLALLAAAMMVLVQLCVGTYHRRLDESQVLRRHLVCLSLAGTGPLSALAIVEPTDRTHLCGQVGVAMLVMSVAVLLFRGTARWLYTRAGLPRVLILGTGPEALEVFASIQADVQRLREVVGFYPASRAAHSGDLGAPAFDRERTLVDIVRTFAVLEIVDAANEKADEPTLMAQIRACRESGVKALTLAEFRERARLESLNDVSPTRVQLDARVRDACDLCSRLVGRLVQYGDSKINRRTLVRQLHRRVAHRR